MAEKLTQEQMRDKYKTRRFMCLVAFYYMLVTIPVAAVLYALKLIDAAFITAVSGVAIGLFGALGLIIMAYIGASTYHDVQNETKNQEGP